MKKYLNICLEALVASLSQMNRVMNSSQGISKNPPNIPTLDFNKLREEGMKLIQELSGDIWTDFNLHDPGITTLEVLCYALTDLGYRTDELIEAYKEKEAVNPDIIDRYFIHADELLPHLPLTKWDFENLTEKNHPKVLSTWFEKYPLLHVSGAVQGGYEVAVFLSHDEEFGNLNSDTIFIPLEDTEAQLEVILFDKENRRIDWGKIKKINNCKWIKDDPDSFFVFERYNCQAALELEISYYHRKPVSTIHTKARITYNSFKKFQEKPQSIEIFREAIIQKLESAEFLQALDQALAKEQYKSQLLADVRLSLLPYRNLCEDFIKLRVVNEQEIKIDAEIILDEYAPRANEINKVLYDQLDDFLWQLMLQAKTPMDESQKTILYASNIIEEMVKVKGVDAANIIKLNLFVDGVPTIPIQDESSFECIHLQGFAYYIPKVSRNKSGITYFRSGEKEKMEEGATAKEFQPHLSCLNGRKPAKNIESKRSKSHKLTQSFIEDLRQYYSIKNDFPQNYQLRNGQLSPEAPEKVKVRVKQFKTYLVFFERILINFLDQLNNFHELLSLKQTAEPKENELQRLKNRLPDLEQQKLIDENIWEETVSSTEGKYNQLLRQHKILDHLLARFSTRYIPISTDQPDVNALEKAYQHKKLILNDITIITRDRGLGLSIKPKEKSIWGKDLLSGFQKRIYRLLGVENRKLMHYQLSSIEGNEPMGFYLVEHLLLMNRKEENILIKKFNKSAELLFNYINNLGIGDSPRDPFSFQLTIILPHWCSTWQQRRSRVETILREEMPAHILPRFYWLDKTHMEDFEMLYENWLKSMLEMYER